MRTLTVYTDPNKPGICDLPPFVLGDDTSWTLQFNDGTQNWVPSAVSMKVGYVNGLVPGSYPSAFRWVDRMNNQHLASFAIGAGCAPGSLSWDEAPVSVMGGNGAWLIQGRTPPSSQLRRIYVKEKGSGYTYGCNPGVTFCGGLGSGSTYDGLLYSSVSSILVTNKGDSVGGIIPTGNYTQANTGVFISGGGSSGGGCSANAIVKNGFVVAIILTNGGRGYTIPPTVTIVGDGSGATAQAVLASTTNSLFNIIRPAQATATIAVDGTVSGIAIQDSGQGYISLPSVQVGTITEAECEASGIETHAVPFFRDPSSVAIKNAVAVVPWSRGRKALNDSLIFDDSLLIIRPSLIATAALSQAGSSPWTGTFNPVTAFVNAVLSFRRSCVMDLQIFGSGRLLYQGAFAVMSVIPAS